MHLVDTSITAISHALVATILLTVPSVFGISTVYSMSIMWPSICTAENGYSGSDENRSPCPVEASFCRLSLSSLFIWSLVFCAWRFYAGRNRLRPMLSRFSKFCKIMFFTCQRTPPPCFLKYTHLRYYWSLFFRGNKGRQDSPGFFHHQTCRCLNIWSTSFTQNINVLSIIILGYYKQKCNIFWKRYMIYGILFTIDMRVWKRDHNDLWNSVNE